MREMKSEQTGVWNRFLSYEDLLEMGEQFQEKYPASVLQVEEMGRSYDNRKILMFSVGRGVRRILITAGVHGRESVNTVVCMHLIEHYCERLIREDKELEQYTFYVLPLLNPDGYMIAQKGFHVIHNQVLREQAVKYSKENNIPYALWKLNSRGADINRDFPSKTWKAKKEGDYPGKQLETKAFMKVVTTRNTDFYVDLHSRGNEIYYYRKEMDSAYNKKQLQIAEKMSDVTGYTLVNPILEIPEGDSGGNTVHYYSEHKKKPAFTIETIPEEETFPLSFHWQQDIYRRLEYLYTVFE